MITTLIMEFEKPHDVAITHSLATKLHGVIMERIESRYATLLHKSELKPYSQNVTFKNDRIIWTINCLNKESSDSIIETIRNAKGFFIRNGKFELIPESVIVSEISEEQLFNSSIENSGRTVTLFSDTVTAFKSNGQYINIPRLKLIFQSIMRKHDMFMESKVFDEEILNHFDMNTVISSYNLRTARYSIENMHIVGYIGQITLFIKGPQQLVNLMNYMLRFSEYSGVGIKTSMGMGKIRYMCDKPIRGGEVINGIKEI